MSQDSVISYARKHAREDRQRAVLQARIDRIYDDEAKAAAHDIYNIDRPKRIAKLIKNIILAIILIILSAPLAGIPLIIFMFYWLVKKTKKRH